MFVPNRVIPYSRQLIEDDDIAAVADVLRSDFLTQGPRVKEFEKALTTHCGARYAVVFATGTAALHAGYFAAGIGKDDEIVTSPITFAATSNAGLYLGAKPVFVDVETDTANINPELIERHITKKTKAIVPVHYGGHPVELEAIQRLARKHGLLVIEDACHALGAQYKGKKIGSMSDLSVFSFHPVKSITTGEGGAVLTENEEYYEQLLLFREHGITKSPSRLLRKDEGAWYYEMHELGFNYRITDIQCALGISQLRKLDRFIQRRREIVGQYRAALADNPWFDLPAEKEYARSSWHLFPVRLRDSLVGHRAEIFRQLREKNLWVQVHYIPVYWHPYYQNLGYRRGLCPVAESFYQREISIPVHPSMTCEDIGYVIETISLILKNYTE
jgi:UDP-4-amino-4,6-dideoxy-N-acetyl-beta-L-altrosamine transaminase